MTVLSGPSVAASGVPILVSVSLSGGLDSSSVYCLAESIRRNDAQRHPPVIGTSFVHVDGSLADESAYLDDIERMYGVTLDRQPAARSQELLTGSRRQLWEGEVPLLSLQWQNFLTLLGHARERQARVLLTGQSGDQVLIDEAYLIDLFRQLRWYRVWADLREIPRWLTDAEPGIFTRDFCTNLAEVPPSGRLRVGLSLASHGPVSILGDTFVVLGCLPETRTDSGRPEIRAEPAALTPLPCTDI